MVRESEDLTSVHTQCELSGVTKLYGEYGMARVARWQIPKYLNHYTYVLPKISSIL